MFTWEITCFPLEILVLDTDNICTTTPKKVQYLLFFLYKCENNLVYCMAISTKETLWA